MQRRLCRQRANPTSRRGAGRAVAAGPAAAETRVALVVGNSAYQTVTRLDNRRNDATLVTGLGFMSRPAG